MSLSGPNQLWQTDITWVWAGGRWYYLSFVVDVYTRQILAAHCSRDLSGLIIHTDRGVQYTSSAYKDYLEDRELTHSMAHYAWQNAYCERVNRTIKEGYLKYYPTGSYASLCQAVAKAVRLYNRCKPHRGLPGRLSPDQFVKERSRGKHPDYHVDIWSELTSTKRLHVN